MLALNSFFHAIRYALDKLKYEDIFLKVKQYQVLASLLEKRDTVAILPTGYGKSIIFHLFPFVYDHINASTLHYGHGCAVLVITPLNSLISDQTSTLKKRGIEAAVLTTTIMSTERRTQTKTVNRRVRVTKERHQKLNPCGYRLMKKLGKISRRKILK